MELIFSFLLGIFIFFFLIATLARMAIKWFIAKASRQGDSFAGFNPYGTRKDRAKEQQQHKTGEVYISQEPRGHKTIKDNVGEYIDFEEVKAS